MVILLVTVEPNANNSGDTPCYKHDILWFFQARQVKELVEKGADIDAEDAYGSLVAHKKVMWVTQRTIISIIKDPFGNGFYIPINMVIFLGDSLI